MKTNEEILEKTIAAQKKSYPASKLARVHVVGLNPKTGNVVVVANHVQRDSWTYGTSQDVGVAEVKPGTIFKRSGDKNVRAYQHIGSYIDKDFAPGMGGAEHGAKLLAKAEDLAARVVAGKARLSRGVEM